jgi:hypothetical protein
MSARLRLASLWMPQSMMTRQIDRIEAATNAALDELLDEHAPNTSPNGGDANGTGRGLDERRAAMARGHETRVRSLIAALGREDAIRLGQEALFKTGVSLGQEARERLRVGDSGDDLLRAARVLYRILGIEFTVTSGKNGENMEVSRCALSKHYSRETCLLLSAVDEGVVKGLNPRAGLRFEKRITDGSPRCVAVITYEGSA